MNATQKPHILLGITGGIAAYKSAELVRLLVRDGCTVQVVMTEAATRFVTPVTFQALSGRPVFTDLWDGRIADNMAHIELSRPAQAIVIAPASADFMAKLAHGLADDLLSTLCLARECPLLVAPAMNRQMWDHAATRRNTAQLAKDGVTMAGPASGDQACGEVGLGRMLEAAQIFSQVRALLAPKALAGRRVLVTAGPTFEAIDAVRGITNRSSGRMGFAVAQAALDAGAEVTLVCGPVELAPPAGARVIGVESAADMFDVVKQQVSTADIFVSVAAVADYTPAKVSEHKLKKSDAALKLELKPTRDILAHVAALPNPPFCVGFAAESRNLEAYAQDKRKRKKLPMIVGNLAQEAIGAADNAVTIFDHAGAHKLPRGPKEQVARQLVAHIAKLYKPRKK
jgi:phosphopantothenoylcysteine decarboxylase/phosphopantothenate--cysteine ligase